MGERRGTKGLELWCRRMTEGYPGVEVNNMTTSWRDGLAFCAIIHHFRPDLIDFSQLSKDDVYKNNQMAFEIAEHHLGIPALLEPDDMVNFPVPDKLSILTYLSQFYQRFVAQGASSGTGTKRPLVSTDRSSVSTTSTNSSPKMAKRSIGAVHRERCTKCDLPVVIAERLHINNHLYHRTCFTCVHCNTQLTLAANCETDTKNQFCCETCPDDELSDQSINSNDQEHNDSYSNLFETALEGTTNPSDSDQFNSLTQARSQFIATQLENADNAPDLHTNIPPISTINEPPDLLQFTKKSDDLYLEDRIKDNIVNNSSLDSVVNSSLSDSDNNQPETADYSLEHFTKECDENHGDVIATDTISDSYKHAADCEDLDASVIIVETHDDYDLVEIPTNETIVTISSDGTTEETDAEYPDHLNPFGDDTTPSGKPSLNPFGSDDDDEEADVPVARKRISARGITSDYFVPGLDTPPKKFLVAPKISLDYSFLNTSYDSPSCRIDRTSQGTTPRKSGLRFSSIHGSNTSLSSVQTSSEHGKRVKKPAPQPPTTLSPQDSTQSSLASSPCTSAQQSPKLSRSRKSRKAPLPPVTSTPLNNNELSDLPPVNLGNLDLNDTAEMDNFEVEKGKVFKDEVNRSRQSQFLDIQSVYTHRRSKGPAPSRPIAQKRTVRPSPFPEMKLQLDAIETQMQDLEKRGAHLEEHIREKCEGPENDQEKSITAEVDNLILELFEIVNKKNALFRRQTELMYLRRQHRLEEQHAELEYEIRCLLLLPEPNKSDTDKAREEELIKRLCDVIEQRNQIVECLENDRIRETEEDDSISNELTTYSSKSITCTDKLQPRDKHKKHKTKSSKKLDVDKDIDESEASPKKEKKKKKFNIF